jgi:hypothetical protein
MQEDRLPSKVILYRHGEVGFKENEMARYDWSRNGLAPLLEGEEEEKELATAWFSD